MHMYHVRKLLGNKNKAGLIIRTSDNYRTYDAALRNGQIDEVDNGEAVLTGTGQEDVITVMFPEIGMLWEEIFDLRRELKKLKEGKK